MSAPSRVMLIIVLCSVLLLGSAPLQPTRADLLEDHTFTVDSFMDIDDVASNSVCSAGDPDEDGPCTLRAAIFEANENSPYSNVTIELPAGTYTLTIPPDSTNDIHSGDLNISPTSTTSYTITLIGVDPEPAVIDANHLDRVFRIAMGVKVVMENVVIRGGLVNATSPLSYGAGIKNEGTLTLDRALIENNELRCGLETCAFDLLGGGIINYGIVYMVDSTIRNNISGRASAFINTGSDFIIRNSTIADNYSTDAFVILNQFTLKIRNSTLSGNATGTGNASGIYNTGILLIESSTFANKNSPASITNGTDGDVTIQDTILLAEPGLTNCANSGDWTSLGYNIYSDASCPATSPGDLINTDPLLAFLGNWGGPTMTLPPQAGSPALDHRDGVCMVDALPVNPFLPLTEDQRHEPRNDGQCDTGAIEGGVVLLKTYLPLALR